MKNLRQNILLTATLSLTFAACHKDKTTPTPTKVNTGIYILNQGVANDNNSTLSFYDYTSKNVTADIFNAANNRGLGDTGNDIEVYGSKMYITVNVSSTLEIVDAHTAKSIKQIKFFNGAVAREPVNIAFYKGNAYVSSYDGTVAVVDTASLTVSKYITVGRNPVQLAVSNGKLYVVNSGGLDYPNYDNTVSVINLSTNTIIKTLTVVENPQNVSVDANGTVYILSTGNYGDILPSLAAIDPATDEIKSQVTIDGSGMVIQGESAYFITSTNTISVYNLLTQTVSMPNFITDGTVITTPYSIAVNGTSGEVFVTDAKNYTSDGTLYAFDKTGKKEYSVTVGINPGKIAFVNK